MGKVIFMANPIIDKLHRDYSSTNTLETKTRGGFPKGFQRFLENEFSLVFFSVHGVGDNWNRSKCYKFHFIMILY